MLDQVRALEDERDAWERKAHALQVAMEEIAGAVHQAEQGAYSRPPGGAEWFAFGLGSVQGDWERFGGGST
jgi:hypothetical protein